MRGDTPGKAVSVSPVVRVCAAMLVAALCAVAAACSLRSSFAESPTVNRSHPAPALTPGDHWLPTSEGRSFLLVVPKHLRHPAPLVVALGGIGWTDAHTREQMQLDDIGAREGAVVAYPHAPGGLWNSRGCCRGATTDDVTYLHQLRDVVASHVALDPGRTLLLGFSNGGMLAYTAACADAGWSHIAVVGATLTAACRTSHPFSITNFNGTRDTVVPWDGGWSNYTSAYLPSVWAVDKAIAAVFRCSPARVSHDGATTTITYSDCAGGTRIREIRVPNLPHHWPIPKVDGYDMGPRAWHAAIG